MYKNFQQAYCNMLNNVYNNGNKVTVRGLDMREIIPGYFEIENPRDRLLNLNSRNKIYRYIFGELMWYLSGNDSVEFIDKYSKVWKRLSDDGVHCNSAYGKYIFRNMPTKGWGSKYDLSEKDYFCSQWEFVKNTLRNDPYSRQAVIHIKPIQMYDTKDVTCTYFLQFFIRDNKLDLVVGMRSNDLIYGTTFDVFMFTFLQELMAVELDLEVGVYKHFASNMHIYMKDADLVSNIVDECAGDKSTIVMPKIDKSFMSKDLPALLSIEYMYWNNLDYSSIKSKLSDVGKFLVNMLETNSLVNI